jgi:sterol desaturase/sphingolipid hydroxylase (fatty acid hydroxylase superfamily)
MMGTLGVVFGFALILIFMKINLYSFWIFGLLRNLHEIHIHSDLKLPGLSAFPFLSKTEHHDLHHSKLNGNYASTFLIWDKLLGTTFKPSDK